MEEITRIAKDIPEKLGSKEKSSTADRSKHVHIRNNFVYQFLNRGEMEIRHCPTSKMVTDLLTQPLPTHTFSILREILSKKTSGTGVSQKSSNT